MVLLLKNKIIVLALFFVFILLLVNCSNNTNTTALKTDTTSCEKPLNPNGDSELALLMRNMVSSSKNLKELIQQEKLPENFPKEFLKIHTAKATDSDTKKESFDRFANNYIFNLQTLYNSPKEDLRKNYNAVINSCANCHSEHCPGPLKAINKLRI